MYMSVLSKHGQLYRCSLPVTMTEDKKDEEEEEEEQRFLSKTLPNVSNLLKPLSEQECLIKVDQKRPHFNQCTYSSEIH